MRKIVGSPKGRRRAGARSAATRAEPARHRQGGDAGDVRQERVVEERRQRRLSASRQVDREHVDRQRRHRDFGVTSASSFWSSNVRRIPSLISERARCARTYGVAGTRGGFITGSDILMDGGVTAAYWYGQLAEVRN